MSNDESEQNLNRARIMDCIAENPGLTINALSSRLRMNHGTIRYHIDVLSEQGRILIKKLSHKDIFFPANVRSGHKGGDDLTRLQTRVLTMIRDGSGIGKESIRSGISITKKELNSALGVLMRRNLIWASRDGEETIYRPLSRKMILESMTLDLIQMFLEHRIDQTTFIALRSQIEEEMKGL